MITITDNYKVEELIPLQNIVKRLDGRFSCFKGRLPDNCKTVRVEVSFENDNYNKFSCMVFIIKQPYF